MNEQMPALSNAQYWEESANFPLGIDEQSAQAVPARKRSFFRTNIFSMNWRQQLWAWMLVIFLSVISYCICNQFVITAVVVEGKSMMPTLREGDHCLLDRWTYRHSSPKRGDLVVLRDPGHKDCAVKRIVALPGEAIQFTEGKVLVNKEALPEPYLSTNVMTFTPDGRDMLVILGKDQYYVLGDNRMWSEDSRYYGPITRDRILGNLAMK